MGGRSGGVRCLALEKNSSNPMPALNNGRTALWVFCRTAAGISRPFRAVARRPRFSCLDRRDRSVRPRPDRRVLRLVMACSLPVEQHRSTMAYSPARLLVDRNSRKLDNLAPFLCFIGNQLAELGRAHRHWLAAEFGKTG